MSKKLKLSLATLPTMLASFSMTVMATEADSGNAVQDILRDDRFSGAMSQISWLTEFIDVWFIRVITVVAFFIISSSLLKNVCAAAYCAFPTFWNKVHEAHGGGASGQGGGGGGGFKLSDLRNMKGMLEKSPSQVLYSLIPDIKALTDFADQEVSPKSYFMRAIPQMCAMVVIGVFIYNGYYRDTAATVGEAGSAIMENVFASVDPDKMVNTLFSIQKRPDNTYKKDKSIEGQYIYQISEEIYKKIKANSDDPRLDTSEGMEQLLRSCEYWAWTFVTTSSGFTQAEMLDEEGNPQVNPTGEQTIFTPTSTFQYSLSNLNATVVSAMGDAAGSSYCTTSTTDASKAFRRVIAPSECGLSSAADGLATKSIVLTGNLTPTAISDETYNTSVQAIQGTLQTSGTIGVTSVTIAGVQADANGKIMTSAINQMVLDAINSSPDKIEGVTVGSITSWNGTRGGTATNGWYIASGAGQQNLGSVTVSFVKEDSSSATGQISGTATVTLNAIVVGK